MRVLQAQPRRAKRPDGATSTSASRIRARCSMSGAGQPLVGQSGPGPAVTPTIPGGLGEAPVVRKPRAETWISGTSVSATSVARGRRR